jgi:hypothetical protein
MFIDMSERDTCSSASASCLAKLGHRSTSRNLDRCFELREWYGNPEEERDALARQARLAEAYLAGKGREGLKRGIFGRRHIELTLELGGETNVFKKA